MRVSLFRVDLLTKKSHLEEGPVFDSNYRKSLAARCRPSLTLLFSEDPNQELAMGIMEYPKYYVHVAENRTENPLYPSIKVRQSPILDFIPRTGIEGTVEDVLLSI
jgi:hypothetical protein